MIAALGSGNIKVAGNQIAAWLLYPTSNTIALRRYCTTNPPPTTESAAAKLKLAVKDYGATVIVFHVTISIASLGICYTAVARCAWV